MYNSTLIHYEEIALKGKNRKYFEKILVENINRLFGDPVEINYEFGRLYISEFLPANQLQAISKLFGISWVAPALKCPPKLKNLETSAQKLFGHLIEAKHQTFAIRTARADKKFPFTSQEVERTIGDLIRKKRQLTVDLENPDITLHIEITTQNTFLYAQKLKGPGGLPTGSSGKVIVLFSGGMDSAVSAYLMGQRGCRVHLLHFHAFPTNAEVKQSKIVKMARKLSSHYPGLTLTLIPYTEYYFKTLHLPQNLTGQELTVFRRFIARCAQKLAQNTKADALVTGDSLGQVASQTMSNLNAVTEGLTLPLFRPLIGFNKREITRIGQHIGMADLANEDYKDCCSLVAKHPSTKANLQKIYRIEQSININELIEKSFSASETLDFN